MSRYHAADTKMMKTQTEKEADEMSSQIAAVERKLEQENHTMKRQELLKELWHLSRKKQPKPT